MSQERCPGASEYGHGLTRTVVHAGDCCQRWADTHLADEDDRGGIIAPTTGPCMECREPTHRVDICFEAHLHYECAPEANRKYWAAVFASPEPTDDDSIWPDKSG